MRRMTRTIVLVALIAATFAPVPGYAAPGTTLAKKALKIAKRADQKATRALAHAKPGRDGTNGTAGAQGAAGPSGASGHDGAPGPRGAEGATGPRGPIGEQGPIGPSGTATIGAISATNPGTVRVEGEGSLVASLNGDAGQVLIVAEGQVNSENEFADAILCELRAGNATVAERYLSLPANDKRSISATAVVTLEAPTPVAFTCRKSDSRSVVEFPAERLRLTALAG